MNLVTNNYGSINTFQMRVVGYWNKIPDEIKMADNVNDFKTNLEYYKKNCFAKKGNYWELSEEIFDRINDENRQSYIDFMTNNPFIAKRKLINVNAYNY